jgi:hypothetical protein
MELAARDDDGRTRGAAFRAQRCDAAGDGDAQAPVGVAVRREHRLRGAPQLAAIGHGEAEPVGGVGQPVEMARPRERPAVVDADRLEHAVADEEPVVER